MYVQRSTSIAVSEHLKKCSTWLQKWPPPTSPTFSWAWEKGYSSSSIHTGIWNHLKAMLLLNISKPKNTGKQNPIALLFVCLKEWSKTCNCSNAEVWRRYKEVKFHYFKMPLMPNIISENKRQQLQMLASYNGQPKFVFNPYIMLCHLSDLSGSKLSY